MLFIVSAQFPGKKQHMEKFWKVLKYIIYVIENETKYDRIIMFMILQRRVLPISKRHYNKMEFFLAARGQNCSK
jgi:hypothetical protein